MTTGRQQWELQPVAFTRRFRSEPATCPSSFKRSKRYREAAEKAAHDADVLEKAVELLKTFHATKFDQSVELIFSLGIDAKQADQMIRGSLSLPHGVGKSKRVIAFCPEHLVADRHRRRRDPGWWTGTGARHIEKENFTDFDVAVATPDMMRFVGRLGKVLGPKGLMPRPRPAPSRPMSPPP